MRKPWFIILLVVLVGVPKAAFAQSQTACKNLPAQEWTEERTDYLAILYPDEYRAAVEPILSNRLLYDAEYQRFSTLFDVELDIPVTLRFYPTLDYFNCLNVASLELPDGQSHSSSGAREISFLVDRMQNSQADGGDKLLNDFRHELAGLFAEQLSDGKAPVGLVFGVKMYAREPQSIYLSSNYVDPGYEKPSQTWRYLWENTATPMNPVLQLSATSIVAFLVDSYGWDLFVQFIHAIPTSESYRHAVENIYQVKFDSLEEQWEQYYPTYFKGRWRAHVFYAFDLSGAELLVENGAYADAIKTLEKIIVFLEKTGQADALRQAQSLLEKARSGEAAGNMVLQARQAIQSGEYQQGLEIANQALAIYDQLGDQRRKAEIESYRETALQVLSLREEVQTLSAQIDTAERPVELAQQLFVIGEQFVRLGDQEGQRQVRDSLGILAEKMQRVQANIAYGLLVLCLVLLGVRIWLGRRSQPVEVL